MCVDGEILKIAQKFSEQGSTDIFVPGFILTYCHAGLSLAVPNVKKASMITRTSENESQSQLVKQLAE